MGRRSCRHAAQCFSESSRSCTMRSRLRWRGRRCRPPVLFLGADPLAPAVPSSSESSGGGVASISACRACHAAANNASWSAESCSLLRLRLASSNSRKRASILFRSLNSRSSCLIRASTICCRTLGSSGRGFGSMATSKQQCTHLLTRCQEQSCIKLSLFRALVAPATTRLLQVDAAQYRRQFRRSDFPLVPLTVVQWHCVRSLLQSLAPDRKSIAVSSRPRESH